MASYGRVSLNGTSVGTETWSVGIAYASDTPPGTWDQGIGDAQAVAIGGVALPANLLLCMSTAFKFTQVRWEQRDGATNALQGVSVYNLPSPVSGTGTGQCPPQTSIVASLRTNTPGPSGRGRFYWPAAAAQVAASSLRLNTPSNTNLATNFKTYLNGIASAITGVSGSFFVSLYPVVYSQKNHSWAKVTRLQVGDVLDTQRRRRDSLPESYASITMP